MYGVIWVYIFDLVGESSNVQFLMEKIKWQEKRIADLENERDFLRSQFCGTTSGSNTKKTCKGTFTI